MMSRPIEVVEPTLVSEAGHCGALFASLRGAAPELPYRLWIDRGASLSALEHGAVRLQRHFARRWRKPQAWWLYRRLLRDGAIVLVPTATYFDLRALDLAAGGRIAPDRVFLYFHKLRISPRRAAALRALAGRQPDLALFGTSEEIVQRLRSAGFTQVQRVVPVLAAARADGAAVPFRHLLSAGAARADKGFSKIVDLVEHLAAAGSRLPIVVQASGDHYGRYDDRTQADLERLRAIRHPPLSVLADTLSAEQYAALFPGAVCLQPYSPAEYGDKMSSVTFDALRAGSPIVTLAGTSTAQIVSASGAGIVVDSPEAAVLARAARTVVDDFASFQSRALEAGSAYRPASSWAPLTAALRRALR